MTDMLAAFILGFVGGGLFTAWVQNLRVEEEPVSQIEPKFK